MKHFQRLVSAQVALGALAVSGAVYSQELATNQAEASSKLEEVVVTAQRRAESLQKSALSIQVLSSQKLAAINQVRDLNEVVPGLQIAAGGNTPQAFIRGVGAFTADGSSQSAVGYNLDGVVIGDPASVMPLFYDLERVEVLKGPQGTLYGRNASAGAINIIPKRPSTDAFGGNFSVEAGNFERRQASAALNVPLSEVVAVRGAVNSISREGYLSDGGDDEDQKGARLQFLYDDHERFSALVGGDYEGRGGKGPGGVYLPRLPGHGDFSGIADLTAAEANSMVAPPLRPIALGPGSGFDYANLSVLSPVVVPGNNNTSVNNEQYGVFSELNYDFGPVVATFIPAYRHSRDKINSYLPFLPFQEDLEVTQKTYELRLSHESDAWKVVIGGFYFDFDQVDDYNTAIGLQRHAHYENTLQTTSYAGFGQATYSLTDTWRVTGGLRYTSEDRSIDGVDTNRNTLPGGATAVVTYQGDATFSDTSYRVGLEYDVSDASMLYATVSTGFKAGGFNAASGADPFDAESVKAYTIGSKNRFFDSSLQVNAEVFYWDVTDSQQAHFAFTSRGDLGFLTVNAGSAESYGVELDTVWAATSVDTFKLQVAYLQTEFGTFTYNIPNTVYFPGAVGCPVTPIGSGPTGAQTVDCSHQELPRAPEWSGNFGYEHEFDLGTHGSLVAGANGNFASSRWMGVDYIPAGLVEDYIRWNASLAYDFPNRDITATAYVQNITDEETAVGGIAPPFNPGTMIANVMAPRTFGIRFFMDF